MSSFYCEHCGALCEDSPQGYTSGCAHYPADIFFVVAGSINQAKEFCRSKNFTFNVDRVVTSPEKLQGLQRGTSVYLVGTYYNLKEFDHIREVLAARQFDVVVDCGDDQ